MELTEFLSILRKWYWLILLASILAGVLAYLVSQLLPPTFVAQASVAITKSGVEVTLDPKYRTISENDLPQSVDIAARRRAMITIAKSSDIGEAVIETLGDRLAPAEKNARELAQSIDVTLDGDLVQIQARAERPDKATLLANTWAQEFEKRINLIYGTSSLSVTDVQAQANDAKKNLEEKEDALVRLLETNAIDSLTRQVRLKQQTLDDVIDTQNKLDRLISDASALQAHLKTDGEEPGRGEELAMILLAASAYSTWSTVPVTLDLQLDLLSTASSEVQLRRLDTLINTLRARRESLRSESIAQTEQELRELVSQLEQEQAERDKLESERDLAKNSYETIQAKLAEVGISGSAPVSVVRVAITADASGEPVSPKPLVNALVAGFLGLALGIVLALGFGILKERGGRNGRWRTSGVASGKRSLTQ